MPLLRNVVRFAYAPFMILGLNVAAYLIIQSGHNYAWLAVLLAAAIGSAMLAERVLPWHEEWNAGHGDETANVLHLAAYEANNIIAVLLLPLIAWLSPWDRLWPADWPFWAQLAGALLFVDFMLMFLHWLSHRTPLLWRLHAVHHGVERLCGLNGLVRHPLHQSMDLIIATGPLALLGMPVDVALLLGFAISIQLIVQHSNVAMTLGPFENVLSIGRIHHLHHVNWGPEGDCNFGLFLTLWDRLFGTFNPNPPRSITARDMGIDEVPNFPKSFREQLLFPFVYQPGQSVPSRYLARPDVQDRDKIQAAE